jgi:hypothetical protein
MECKNIRSRRHPAVKCRSPATHGDYCGRHFRNPTRWRPAVRRLSTLITDEMREAGAEIVAALKLRWRLRSLLRQGPARFSRDLSNNTTDLVSGDDISAIKGCSFFSYRDPSDSNVYSFDIRSIHSLLHHATLDAAIPLNPYTRAIIPSTVVATCMRHVEWCRKHGVGVEWTPLVPPTPEQQFTLRIVELFHEINELNYYSSPEWFLGMDVDEHRLYYRELYDIWTFRAFLSAAQKNTIVPDYQRKIFQRSPLHIPDTLEALQRLNRSTIKHMIRSAVNVNDRILGAMYVISAFTMVNEDARAAYPWLYESVHVEEEAAPVIEVVPHRPFGFLAALLDGLVGPRMPVLRLPPPHPPDMD